MLNLLEYTLKHCKAIDLVMQQCKLGLRDLELTDEEWVIVGQLQSVLKVSKMLHWCVGLIMQTNVIRSLRMQCCTSHARLQILQWSSQQWTTLSKSSQHIRTTRNFFHLYALASPSLGSSQPLLLMHGPVRSVLYRYE